MSSPLLLLLLLLLLRGPAAGRPPPATATPRLRLAFPGECGQPAGWDGRGDTPQPPSRDGAGATGERGDAGPTGGPRVVLPPLPVPMRRGAGSGSHLGAPSRGYGVPVSGRDKEPFVPAARD
ncbi:hypothetical protein LUU34_00216800 [Aix galericulata]|nr:hypothetical protein LUU34_00216800 [Aix galericulata]